MVHGDLALSPLTWASVKDGWPYVLGGLKSVVETGRPLPPRAEVGPTASEDVVEGAGHH